MICRCDNVELGSYANQVTLEHGGKLVSIDRCIADEVQRLWSLGITTMASCCGHGKAPAYIGVSEADVPAMLAMGYGNVLNTCNPSDNTLFAPLGH